MYIELRNIGVQYPGKDPLFRQVRLTLREAEFILVQGPSGSGKSSLLRLINRLQEPQEGEIRVDGRPIAEHEVTGLRRRIGYVQQVPVMLEGSVEKNLLLPFQFRSAGLLERPGAKTLRDWLDKLGLKDVQLTDQAQQLSVGQKQRVALIRTLLAEPEVLLCDEPTSALDANSRLIVEDWLQRLHSQKKLGIILVTHFEVEFSPLRPRRFRLQADGLVENRA